MLRDLFIRIKSGTEYLNYGRDIIADWGADFLIHILNAQDKKSQLLRILDLGCGHGTDLLNIKNRVVESLGEAVTIELHGIENYEDYILECKNEGIRIQTIDIEKERFSFANSELDLLIANQILEHTKEIFWIMSEAARVLKPGGRFLVGVPNLASLHNRLLLLFGEQPTAQQSLSAHIRGFTKPDFTKFAEEGGFFRVTAFRGSNFYPFPPIISRSLSRLFPSFAFGIFFLLERTERNGSFLEYLKNNLLETPFYGGPANPARSEV